MRRFLKGLLAALLVFAPPAAMAQTGSDSLILFGKPKPVLDLNLAVAGAFPPSVTFTRASTATYANSSGVLTTASSGVPRFTYDPTTITPLGYLSEAAATNIQFHSQFDSGWSVTGGTLTANNVTSPDGSSDAATFTEDTSTGLHAPNITATTTITANTIYTGSMWLKAGTRTNAVLSWENAGPTDAVRVNVNLSACTVSAGSVVGTGVISGTPASQQWPNGWCRVFIAGTINAASTAAFLIPYGANPAGTVSYTGTSATFQAFGADVKVGLDRSSYISTTTASVTRAADSATVAASLFPLSQTAGTLVVSAVYISQPAANFGRFLSLVGANANTDELSIYIQQATGASNGAATVANVSVSDSGPVVAVGSSLKAALSFTPTRLAFSANGAAPVVAVNTVGLPVITKLQLAGAVRFQLPQATTIARARYYQTAVSDAFLQGLSR